MMIKIAQEETCFTSFSFCFSDKPIYKIGTTGGTDLEINQTVISIEELSKAHTETFPKLFG